MAALVLGVDLGTTTITGLTLEPGEDAVLATETIANDGEVTSSSDRIVGRSEWDPDHIVARACQCLRAVVDRLGTRSRDIVGVGITGQQHGVVLVDRQQRPMTPLVNWQDRRGDDPFPDSPRTYVEQAIDLTGEEAGRRTGCRLATGYMGLTLFWWQTQRSLPAAGTACFIGDYLASVLTGQPPVSDPTNAASSGVFDVRRRCWDGPMLAALGLPESFFPEIREADQPLGPLSPAAAAATGLCQGIPVYVALGDSQAAFLGSVEDRRHDVLINIGTGAQVITAIEQFQFAPPLETRPLPRAGHVLVSAQPCGGRAYALLEQFFRNVLQQCGGLDVPGKIYDTLNRLADDVPSGCDGLRCRPLFTGTRAQPELRASWTGASPENFTPAHMVRALLEGVADVLYDDYLKICQVAGTSHRRVVGSGNGLRKNRVLQRVVAGRFALPLHLVPSEEEAAVGAARMAALGTGAAGRTPAHL